MFVYVLYKRFDCLSPLLKARIQIKACQNVAGKRWVNGLLPMSYLVCQVRQTLIIIIIMITMIIIIIVTIMMMMMIIIMML